MKCLSIGFDLVRTKLDSGEAPSSAIQKQSSSSNKYFFKTLVVGVVAISCIAQPELAPLIIGAGLANAV